MSHALTEQDLQAAESIFRAYLREHGLKYTPERRTLLFEVMANEQHFEAEQLLINMRQAGKRVAKATIYRTLPLLVNCGIVKQVRFGDKMAHYEHILGHAPHDHMVCLKCHRIVEFDSAEIVDLRSSIASRHCFQASGHRFQITGLCGLCAGSGAAPVDTPGASQ